MDLDTLLRLFLQEKKIVQTKLDSADKFFQEILPRFFIKEVSPIIVYDKTHVIWLVIDFLSVNIAKPTFKEQDDSTHLLYPNECLLRNLTYSLDVRATTQTRLYAADESFRSMPATERDSCANSETLEGIQCRAQLQFMQIHKDVLLVNLGAMVGSGLCNTRNLDAATIRAVIRGSLFEDGGQFIIDGVERTLKYAERLLAYDTPLYTVCKKEPYSHMVENRSGHPHIARSSSTLRIHVTSTRTKNRSLHVRFNQNAETKPVFVPVGYLLRSLGLVEQDIRILCAAACPQAPWLWTSMHETIVTNNLDISKHLTTQDKALTAMGQCMNKSTTKPLHFARRHISKEMLPHISYNDTEFRRKAYEVCLESMELCDRLYIEEFQERILAKDPSEIGDHFDPWDNKDKYANKGIETPVDLLSNFFRPSFKGAIKNLKRQIRHVLKSGKPLNLATIWKPATGARPLLSAIGTGLWNVSKMSNSKTGFTERYDHQNPFAALTQQYRINSGAPKEGKAQSMRLIWGSFGVICPLASTEGPTCGLIKELNPLVSISLGVDPSFIRLLLLEQKNVHRFEQFSTELLTQYHQDKKKTFAHGDLKEMQNFPLLIPLTVNGDPFAFCSQKNPMQLVNKVKEWRRKNIISKHTSISVRYLSPFFLSPLFWKHKPPAPGDAAVRQLLSNKIFQIKSIDIRTGGTRPVRPLFVVEKLPLFDSLQLSRCSWSELVTRGIIDYIDQREEECSFVAANRKSIRREHEFLELHDIASLGLAASGLPFLHHNPPSKTTHQSQRLKQIKAAGIGLDYARRCDTNMFHLAFPERPCVQTSWLRVLGMNRVGMGHNVIIAVTPSTGESQEDSPILARQPVELGLFRNRVSRSSCVIEARAPPKDPKKEVVREQCEFLELKTIPEKNGLRVAWRMTPHVPVPVGRHDMIESFGPYKEEECVNPKKEDFLGVESDGLVGRGYFVMSGNVMAQKSVGINPHMASSYQNLKGKTVPMKVYDVSVSQKRSDYGHVEQVFLTQDNNGDRMAKFKVSKAAPPIPADKFSSRHGQKGVAAIVINQEDMPYDPVTGIVPHMLIDIVGSYGRVTPGQHFECAVSGICDLAGIRQVDGTPWTDQNLEEIRQGVLSMGTSIDFGEISYKEALGKVLCALGLPPSGCQRLADGVTGKLMDAHIFMHPCYYTSLKQQVADKMRARSTGKMDPSLGQPVGTKKNGGGIKVGEMELNCLKWHGASANLEGRTFRSSDSGNNTHICSICKDFIFSPAQPDGGSGSTYCMPCRQLRTGSQSQLPLGFKSWAEEIRTTGCNITCHPKLVSKTGC